MSKEKEQIIEMVDRVQEVVDLFYQQSEKEAFEKFTVILDNIAAAVDCLAVYEKEHESFTVDETKLRDILTEAMNALKSEDLILMADILQYDFIEYINDIIEKME